MNVKRILPLELNFELKNFKDYFKGSTIHINQKKKHIFFLDAATYNNLGDQAISVAISEYVQENFEEYEYVEISERDFLRNLLFLKKNIHESDMIFLSGGGNMGDMYPRYEAIRRKVIKNFKKNPIIIFPQTIDYQKDRYGNRELKRSKKLYNSNKNLIICARENKSYEIMKKIYNKVFLVSDIVFFLYGKIKLKEVESNKVGICLRDDKESIFTLEERNSIINYIQQSNDVIKISTMSDIKYIDKENRKRILIMKLEELKKCSVIVTDRLHGMIFSIICNIPCVVFDNSNNKVFEVLNTVCKYFPNIKKISKDNASNITDIISNVINEKYVGIKNSKEIFEELTNCIKSINEN